METRMIKDQRQHEYQQTFLAVCMLRQFYEKYSASASRKPTWEIQSSRVQATAKMVKVISSMYAFVPSSMGVLTVA